MGMFTHLGGMRLGTVREGASNNMGVVNASQSGTIAFAADGTVTTLFKIPAGAQIINIHVDTTTVFNAATTNTIKIGTTSGGAELVADTAIGPLGRASLATTGVYTAWANVGSSDVTIYATYNQTGTAATTGAGRITVQYAVKNDDGSVANAA